MTIRDLFIRASERAERANAQLPEGEDPSANPLGEFLLDLAGHLRSDIARGGSDPVMLESNIRRSANELHALGVEMGAQVPVSHAPTVIAPPQQFYVPPINQQSAHAAAPMALPPNTLPALVQGPPEVNAQGQRDIKAAEPLPGENPALDLHRANLAALGVPRPNLNS